MKFRKIHALLLSSLLFAACSDDDVTPNINAQVNMEQETMTVKENKGIFNVPVTVSGDQLNSPIRVTVEVAEEGANPAMEDVHYLVTSKSILIAAGETSGYIEISTVDDDQINDIRNFSVSITKVEGATVGENASTIVSLRDNDAAFYEKLQGNWKMNYTSPYTGGGSWSVSVIGHDETEEGYDETLYITGMMGYDWTQATMKYTYDRATNKVKLAFEMGTMFAEGVNFGSSGINDVFLGTVVDGKISTNGTIDGDCSEDFSTITFDTSKILYFFLAPTGTGQLSGSLWDAAGQIVMTRN